MGWGREVEHVRVEFFPLNGDHRPDLEMDIGCEGRTMMKEGQERWVSSDGAILYYDVQGRDK